MGEKIEACEFMQRLKRGEIKLEERECKCGCGKKFKVLPTSEQRYALALHDPNYHKPHDFNENEGLKKMQYKKGKV